MLECPEAVGEVVPEDHYGVHSGYYTACHLAPALHGSTFAEWDETTTTGLDCSDYRIAEGQVTVPDRPGFGLSLDTDFFAEAVKRGGGEINLQKTQ